MTTEHHGTPHRSATSQISRGSRHHQREQHLHASATSASARASEASSQARTGPRGHLRSRTPPLRSRRPEVPDFLCRPITYARSEIATERRIHRPRPPSTRTEPPRGTEPRAIYSSKETPRPPATLSHRDERESHRYPSRPPCYLQLKHDPVSLHGTIWRHWSPASSVDNWHRGPIRFSERPQDRRGITLDV